jgi:hypothetical protein
VHELTYDSNPVYNGQCNYDKIAPPDNVAPISLPNGGEEERQPHVTTTKGICTDQDTIRNERDEDEGDIAHD